MPWKKTTPSSPPGSMLNKGTKQLFVESWERTTLIFESSLFLLLWPKPPEKWSRNSPHSMPSMPRSSTSLRGENFPLDDLSIME